MPGGRAGAEVALLQGRAGQATHAQRQRRPGGLWGWDGVEDDGRGESESDVGMKVKETERRSVCWLGKGNDCQRGGPPLVPPSVIADTARSTRAPDPLCLCFLVAACCRATPLARFHATPGLLQMWSAGTRPAMQVAGTFHATTGT